MALEPRQNRIGEIQRLSRITDLVGGHVEEQTGMDRSGHFFETSAPLANSNADPHSKPQHHVSDRSWAESATILGLGTRLVAIVCTFSERRDSGQEY